MKRIGSAGKNLLGSVIAVVIAGLISTHVAQADVLQYTFAGTAAGDINGGPIGPLPFTLTFTDNTSNIVNQGGGFFRYNNETVTVTSGSFVTTVAGVTVVVNGNAGDPDPANFVIGESVNFFNPAFNDGLGLDFSSALLGYNLSTAVSTGLVTGADLTPTLNGIGGGFLDSFGDTDEITGDTSLSFTAVDLTPPAVTPEPSSWLLLTTGLSGIGLLRRHFINA